METQSIIGLDLAKNIIQAAQLPDTKFIPSNSQKQQQLQSRVRLKEFAVKQKTA